MGPSLYVAVAAMLSQGPATSASAMFERPLETPRILYERARLASGAGYCEESARRSQARAFDRRYGERVLRLSAVIKAQESEMGWTATDLAGNTCRKSRRKWRSHDLDSFAGALQLLEDRYGLGAPALETSVCKIVKDIKGHQGRRVKVRGVVQYSHPESGDFFADVNCGAAISLGIFDSRLTPIPYGKIVDGREHLAFVTLTGTVRERACVRYRPPGSTCGPYLSVDRSEDITRTDLCWNEARRSNKDAPFLAICPPG
jgi:hypothetical protein